MTGSTRLRQISAPSATQPQPALPQPTQLPYRKAAPRGAATRGRWRRLLPRPALDHQRGSRRACRSRLVPVRGERARPRMGGVPVAGGLGAGGFNPRTGEAGCFFCSFARPSSAARLEAPSPCHSRPEASSRSRLRDGVPPRGVAPQAPSPTSSKPSHHARYSLKVRLVILILGSEPFGATTSTAAGTQMKSQARGRPASRAMNRPGWKLSPRRQRKSRSRSSSVGRTTRRGRTDGVFDQDRRAVLTSSDAHP